MSTESNSRAAVITGASSGIGAATARALAFAISRPRSVSLNDILVRPTAQV